MLWVTLQDAKTSEEIREQIKIKDITNVIKCIKEKGLEITVMVILGFSLRGNIWTSLTERPLLGIGRNL